MYMYSFNSACDLKCNNCTDGFGCAQCVKGYYIKTPSICGKCDPFCVIGKCLPTIGCTECITQFFLSSPNYCDSCSLDCDVCNVGVGCTLCSEGYYLYNTVCYSTTITKNALNIAYLALTILDALDVHILTI